MQQGFVFFFLLIFFEFVFANVCGPIVIDCKTYRIRFSYSSPVSNKTVQINEEIACGKGKGRKKGSTTWGGNGSIGSVNKGYYWQSDVKNYTGSKTIDYIPINGIRGNAIGDHGTAGESPIGNAIHVGKVGGPISNGCVRVTPKVMNILKSCPNTSLTIIGPSYTGGSSPTAPVSSPNNGNPWFVGSGSSRSGNSAVNPDVVDPKDRFQPGSFWGTQSQKRSGAD